jgi:hypothetical protein
MAYSSGNCPQCGVKLNLRESSIDAVRRCEACGFEFAARKASFSLTGCLGNLFSLIGVSIFILLCCGAVAIFIFAMNHDWSPPPVADSTPITTPEAAPVEPAVTPQDLPPEPMPEPSPTVQPELAVDQKQSTATDIRTWTDKTGKFSTDASFGGMAGGSVTLHKADGTTIKIPLDQLSQSDQDWIAARRKNPVTKPRP